MRRLLKAALIACLAAVVILALGWHVLRSAHVREAVERRLSAMVGQPVTIGRLTVVAFPRPVISGTDVRVGVAEVVAPALSVDRIVILPRLRQLLTGSVIIEEIQLDGFTVGLLRDAEGAWHAPAIAPAPTPDTGAGAVVERVRIKGGRVRIFDAVAAAAPTETASIDAIAADVTVADAGLRFWPMTATIGSAQISADGRANGRTVRLEFTGDRVTDKDLPPLLALLGSKRPAFLRLGDTAAISGLVELNRQTGDLSGKGHIRSPDVRIDPLRLERLEAPFTMEGRHVRFDPITFGVHGGEHRGRLTVQMPERNSRPRGETRWTADSRVTGLQVGAFLRALSGSDQRVDGGASLSATLGGSVERDLQQTVSGPMSVTIVNGIIRQFPLLAAVNRVLRLAEQNEGDTQFERLTGSFVIAAGQATTDDLVLEAQHVRVEAAGRIGADRSLALRGTANVSPDRSARAIASVRELSGLRNARGEIQLPLTISGTLDQPSFGLDIRGAMGKGIRDELRRRLWGIIRR